MTNQEFAKETLMAARNIIANSDLYKKGIPHVRDVLKEVDALLAPKPKEPAKCPLYFCPSCLELDVTLIAEQSFMANTLEHYCFNVKTQDSDAKAHCIKCNWTGEHRNLGNYQAVQGWHNSETNPKEST